MEVTQNETMLSLTSRSFGAGRRPCLVTGDMKRPVIDKLPCAVCISEYEKMMVLLPRPCGIQLSEIAENAPVYLEH